MQMLPGVTKFYHHSVNHLQEEMFRQRGILRLEAFIPEIMLYNVSKVVLFHPMIIPYSRKKDANFLFVDY